MAPVNCDPTHAGTATVVVGAVDVVGGTLVVVGALDVVVVDDVERLPM
jgi:hypothetical protein